MSKLLDQLLTPEQKAQADRIDAAMLQLSGLLAERAVLQTTTQALDVSRRAAFEAIHQDAKPVRCEPLQGDVDEDSCTSLQPLGDASVMVVYSYDGNDLSIDGVDLADGFVPIDCFTSAIRGQWYRAIRAEERKNSEIDREAAMARYEE